ncbi:MAG: LamB/YcsF family protein [Anaeromyxobacteraceae bacterium]
MARAVTIDLNCDMGEGEPSDERVMPFVTSVNVACGFHAGDAATMRRTVRLARAHGLAVGAHPSYADREGFGRRALDLDPEQVRDEVVYQIGALWGICRAEGARLVHVKPHGALYNTAAGDPALALAVCDAVRLVDPSLVVVCLAGSRMVEQARRFGLACAEEAFADRAYTSAGTLVPRSQPGAVIHDPQAVAERALRIVTERRVTSIDGRPVSLSAQTLCIHGDTPGAERLAAAVRARLEAEGVAVAPVAR